MKLALLKGYKEYNGIPVPQCLTDKAFREACDREDVLVEFKMPGKGDYIEFLGKGYAKVTDDFNNLDLANFSEGQLYVMHEGTSEFDSDGDAYFNDDNGEFSYFHITWAKLIPKGSFIEYGTSSYGCRSAAELHQPVVGVDCSEGIIKAQALQHPSESEEPRDETCSRIGKPDPAFIKPSDWNADMLNDMLLLKLKK